jgi:hypothetical protein
VQAVAKQHVMAIVQAIAKVTAMVHVSQVDLLETQIVVATMVVLVVVRVVVQEHVIALALELAVGIVIIKKARQASFKRVCYRPCKIDSKDEA